MSTLNRMANSQNRYQGDTKKVLCVCSAGLLRSPTLAHVLSSPPYNFNTRAAGANDEYALVPVDETLLYWADEIVCVERKHYEMLREKFDLSKVLGNIIYLDVPDRFPYRDPELVALLRKQYDDAQMILGYTKEKPSE